MVACKNAVAQRLRHLVIEGRLEFLRLADLEEGVEIAQGEEEHHIVFLHVHSFRRKLRDQEFQQRRWYRTYMIDLLNGLTIGCEVIRLVTLPVTTDTCDTRPLLVGLVPSKNMPSIGKDTSCTHELCDGRKDKRWHKGCLLLRLEAREERACELHGSAGPGTHGVFKFSVREHGVGDAILEAEPVES